MTWVIRPGVSSKILTSGNTPKINLSRKLGLEGADIIAVDICHQIDSVPYPLSTPADLAETVQQVEALDRRILAREADVRDGAELKAAFDAGVAELGPADIVLANAGISPMSLEEVHDAWRDAVEVNLTGVFNTVETAIPSMIERGLGGAIVLDQLDLRQQRHRRIRPGRTWLCRGQARRGRAHALLCQ